MHNLLDLSSVKIRGLSRTNYKPIDQLGRGGNSFVYLVIAQDGIYRGVPFALKTFTKSSDAERLEKFEHEIDFLRNCDHPAIMRVFDSGTITIKSNKEETKYPFVVCEYLPKTLHIWMRSQTTTLERVSFTLQLLSALALLHSHRPKIVHRDIKPQNIFVKARSCVLGDFGLIKFLDDDDSDRADDIFKLSDGPGMPRMYRTPDLVSYAKQEAPLTEKSDVFQLGLVIAELFTGVNPCKDCKDRLDPVELHPLMNIWGSNGGQIQSLIQQMLVLIPYSRPSASDLIDAWQGLFLKVAQQSKDLEGRVYQ